MEINWSAYLESFVTARSKVTANGRWDQSQLSALIDYLQLNANESPGLAAFAWAETAGGATTRKQRVSLSRSFLEFVSAFEGEVDTPPKSFLPATRRSEPFIFTNEEVLLLMEGANQARPAHSLRPVLLKTLFGLLASTVNEK